MKDYVGNPLQIRGAEQYVLQNGRGDGMHFLYVRNGRGLEVWISVDRAGDVSRVSYKGDNMSYFSPCGYVAPQYYDYLGKGFLKSFTAGFFTTCGLTAVGAPCEDEGEQLPMHGTVSNIPAEVYSIEETAKELTVKLRLRDSVIFGRHLLLERKYVFSYEEDSFSVIDTVTNEADRESPHMVLYHCNFGYPLLSENSLVKIPSDTIYAKVENAQKHIATALQMEKPQAEYEERCYYFDVKEKDGRARVGLYNDDIGKGVILDYDKSEMPCFTQWKMMGKSDYVLGLEPGNCTPAARGTLRQEGVLRTLAPDESGTTGIKFIFTTDKKEFEGAF